MKLRAAFAGFRHGHIFSVYEGFQKRDDVEIVAACEDHPETRAALAKSGRVKITHESFQKMMDEAAFDILAVGDYYGRRGSLIVEGLRRGKHCISDKPICIRLSELDEMARILQKNKLALGCQFDLRSDGLLRAMRKLVADNMLGEVHAISYDGQHPMQFGSRPGWYFEEGKHGGTINDLAIHAFDAIPWITGLRFAKVNAARNWNARLKQVPHFKDAAQVMCTMSNGCGVLGDVSYFSPDSVGYSLPMYWRFTLWGSEGVAEKRENKLLLYHSSSKVPRVIPPENTEPAFYLDSFLREIQGRTVPGDVVTSEVLTASRNTLLAQKAADENLCNLALV